MNGSKLEAEYLDRYETILKPLADRLAEHVRDSVSSLPRVDRVTVRAKSPDRFLEKAKKTLEDGSSKYRNPLDQIQDMVGARIIVFYKSDVDNVSDVIDKYFRRIECKNMIPDSPNEFGYVGKHYVLAVPKDILDDTYDGERTPQFFELQVKTLFQHAWSEAEHDLAYKPEGNLTPDQRRQVAFTAAQAWGADLIFQQLYDELSGMG
jgi:putative GTP pyrophosphokinase